MPIGQGKAAKNPLRFSNFELDLRAGELRKHGIKIKLQDQPLQILSILLENPGEVVTREQLRERLWPADTFVDFDHSLNSAVKKLRQALNDDPDTPRFIETLPRRGYRFIAQVGHGEGAAVQGESAEFQGLRIGAAAGAASTTPSSVAATHHWKPWATGGLGFVLALSLVLLARFLPFRSATVAPPIRLIPLTTWVHPYSRVSFSPDGNQVAFSWEGENPHGLDIDIYVKQIGAEKTLQITRDFGVNYYPAWSPDGRYIAFMHASRTEKAGIYIVSSLGGPARKLIELQHVQDCHKSVFSWSPDGNLLTFSDKLSPTDPCTVNQLSLDDLRVRQLSHPPAPSTGDLSAELSPEGENIALVRNTKEVEDIYVMPASGGEAHRITFDNRLIFGLAWTSDGKEIIFSSNRGGANWGLWRIRAVGGTPERLPVGSDAYYPAVSLKGHRLAYASGIRNENIWRLPIERGHRLGKPDKWISSSMLEQGPQYSPDGKRIAFQSTRSGNFEIWRADADGSNLVQLTSFGGPLTGTPRWAPDGRSICFDSRPEPHSNIHIVGADGGPVRRLINETSDDSVPSWSHDGRWIYFASNRTHIWQIWKRKSDGGAPIQITKDGGFAPLESPDGKFLYYTKFDVPGAWRVPVQGGMEMKILDEPPEGYWGYFAVGPDGLYFSGDTSESLPALKFYDFATRKITVLSEMERKPSKGAPGLSVSPDGRVLLYVQVDEARNNLMLAENFR